MSDERRKDGSNHVGPGSGSPFGGQASGPGQPGTNKPQNVPQAESSSPGPESLTNAASTAEAREANNSSDTGSGPVQGAPAYSVGGTGGPGMPGKPDQVISTRLGFDQMGDDTMHHQYMHMVSTTGAIGAKGSPPPVNVPQGAPIPEEVQQEAMKALDEQIDKLTEEETLKALQDQSIYVQDVIAGAQAKMLSVAYVQGRLLNHLHKLMLKKRGNWVDYIEKAMPELKRGTREKYMLIAKTPGVLSHAKMGIDRAGEVIKVMAPIRSMLDDEDPIGDLFNINGVVLDYSMDKLELRSVVKAVIAKTKLASKGIKVEVATVIDFHRTAGPITPEDMAVMTDRKEQDKDPNLYLIEVISRNGLRIHNLSDKKDPKPPVKYVNAESVKLTESINALLGSTIKPAKIDKIHLEALLAAVTKLIERCAAS